MIEYAVLEKLLPAMAEIMNAVPGEGFRMQEEDTLLILQRRMEECQLKEELVTFNEMFALKDACAISQLCTAMLAYFKIKLLVEAKQEKFTPRLERELLKEYDAQRTKITNLLHLSKVNAITADAYQKETIELAMKKNKAFLEAFDIEIAALEERNERQQVNREQSEPLQEEQNSITQQVKTKQPQKRSALEKIHSLFLNLKEKKRIEEKLKEVEKTSSETRCREIPYYASSLTFTEVFPCKDIPAYSLMKRKNNVYFGMSKNVKKSSYDNRDQSLIELTEASEEFLQFMREDLLSGEYELSAFTKREKDGLIMYFNFLSECFKKQIGVTLMVQEYLDFKKYYNRLVLKMFELEKKEKENYYKALALADRYITYLESYDVSSEEKVETIIFNILHQQAETYKKNLNDIISNHVVDEEAKQDLEELIDAIRNFYKTKDKNYEERKLPMQESYLEPQIRPVMVGSKTNQNQKDKQIIIQILNQKQEIVDEAVYSDENIEQALFDFERKGGYLKRLGIRSDGQDLFYQEKKEREE